MRSKSSEPGLSSQEKSGFRLPSRQLWVWILSLAALAVGARNFEEGMSIDGPLYAAIARNIARSGEWFFLHGGVPDFVPFVEHTHLGFWIQALFLRFFRLPIGRLASRATSFMCFFWV